MKLISDVIKKLMMACPYYGLFLSGLKKEYTDAIEKNTLAAGKKEYYK